MLETFIAALAAALLALVGNYFMLGLQTRARVREELRAFVRELHDETVALVVDLVDARKTGRRNQCEWHRGLDQRTTSLVALPVELAEALCDQFDVE